MGKVESILKSEMQRLAKKEVRTVFSPLRREVRTMRIKLSGLVKTIAVLDRMAKEKARQESKQFTLEAPPEEVKASRFSPDRIRNLRRKLGLSQKELAFLAGVSLGAVGAWEKGRFEPKMNKKTVLVALRKLNKRTIKKVLAEKKAGLAKEPANGRVKRRRAPARRKRAKAKK